MIVMLLGNREALHHAILTCSKNETIKQCTACASEDLQPLDRSWSLALCSGDAGDTGVASPGPHGGSGCADLQFNCRAKSGVG